jgi:hypothetical protein
MYAVGSFTTVMRYNTRYTRNHVFSFAATAPFKVTSWDPAVNGIVNSIAFNGSDCSDAYIGGAFTSVGRTAAHDIAEISTSTGAVVTRFARDANGQVETLLGVRGRILAGGDYTSINGSDADPYMTGLNPATGRDDGFLRLHVFGHYQYPNASGNPTRVYNQQLSHSGTLDLVEGDFTSVGGHARQQVFMLHLGTALATVTGWDPTILTDHCVGGHPFYAKAAAWSPSDTSVYVATTGYHLSGWKGSFPLTGPCDAALAFPATTTQVSPEWINYTGCYSLFSIAADASTVYVAGHEKYADNPDGCKGAGKGAVSAPGLGGLSPATGALTFNPTRSRGYGADDMLLTGAGLWIASDNDDGSQMCGRQDGHAGICFLPYR